MFRSAHVKSNYSKSIALFKNPIFSSLLQIKTYPNRDEMKNMPNRASDRNRFKWTKKWPNSNDSAGSSKQV